MENIGEQDQQKDRLPEYLRFIGRGALLGRTIEYKGVRMKAEELVTQGAHADMAMATLEGLLTLPEDDPVRIEESQALEAHYGPLLDSLLVEE